jgi:hypothetical protein
MLEMLATLAYGINSALKTRRALTFENLALRHQLAVLQRDSADSQPRGGEDRRASRG